MNLNQKPHMTSLSFDLLFDALSNVLNNISKSDTVVIYGTGKAAEFIFELCNHQGIRIKAFLDDFKSDINFSDLPVCQVKKGIDIFNPDAIILGSITSHIRMKQNLIQMDFAGKIISIEDPNFEALSPDINYPPSNKDKISKFKNRHNTESCFIICNGPSLTLTPPTNILNHVTIASNKIFLYDKFIPTYYCVSDSLIAKNNYSKINSLDWSSFYPSSLSSWLHGGIYLKSQRPSVPHRFSTDISNGIELGGSVTYFMLQLAYFLGFQNVYLIGADHSYSTQKSLKAGSGILKTAENDINHFHPDYFGNGTTWHEPDFERMNIAFKLAKEAFERDGRKIYNATHGGHLEIFDRISFEEALNS